MCVTFREKKQVVVFSQTHSLTRCLPSFAFTVFSFTPLVLCKGIARDLTEARLQSIHSKLSSKIWMQTTAKNMKQHETYFKKTALFAGSNIKINASWISRNSHLRLHLRSSGSVRKVLFLEPASLGTPFGSIAKVDSNERENRWLHLIFGGFLQ